MKRNYCLSLVLLALFGTTSFAPVYASGAEGVQNSQSIQQTKKITGKVVDSAGEPVVGASVLVKEAGTGSVSDLDGKFTVEAAQGYTLMISFVGYRTTEIKVTNESF